MRRPVPFALQGESIDGVIFEPGERFRLHNLTKHQIVKGTIYPYRGEWME